MALSPSTSARGNVASCCDVDSTPAKSCATKALAAPAERRFSRKSAAIAGEQSYSHRCHAVLGRHRADSLATDPRPAVIHRLRTIVTRMTRLAPNARTWLRSDACVANIASRINRVGTRKSAAEKYAARSYAVVRILAGKCVIARASAKMQADKPASNLAGSPRVSAGIRTRIRATRPLPAKRTSHVRARSSLLVHARRRSRR